MTELLPSFVPRFDGKKKSKWVLHECNLLVGKHGCLVEHSTDFSGVKGNLK